MGKKNFYVVKAGFKTGVFDNWPECQAAVKGYKGAVYRGFETKEEALVWQNHGEVVSGASTLESPEDRLVQSLRDYDYEVYTDGSYRDGKYSYGYVFVKEDEAVFEGKGCGENLEAAVMRNVAGEIAAVIHAVKRAESLKARIRIYHDYSGIAHWVTGAWQAKNKFTQAYVAFMRQHQDLYSFEKVAGHSGNRFNDYADRLAKEALGIMTN
ncbi:putative double-stranded RNA/RNA-DNA hybrid binding protein [Desulfosporosinus acidiphilus SJ4]|uniref:Ribonuclease H n=1 Tax=Desulfosporosinus acidiphilus (strain DSM 22704 / JCM 16185 / SJ4) TaxID=646529 RepID=I4D800_DESAJ|nr:ribonuclease H family protein [Desulfosporosinus acidiphilus]AFM41924.1 putative double-stranded RNA/RNA-DNA hybrid binding protein [Desulfosporosinus acidiphilus SJ4]